MHHTAVIIASMAFATCKTYKAVDNVIGIS